MKVENIVLHHLLHDEAYVRKVIPFIKSEYFQDAAEKHIFESLSTFVSDYKSLPSLDAMRLMLDKKSGLSQDNYLKTVDLLSTWSHPPTKVSEQWLLDETEKFCQDKAIYNAIMDSIQILDGKGDMTKENMPELLKTALAVSFDSNIGHDFFENFDQRYDYYHRKEEKIPFDLEFLNKVTNGGVSKKTLNVIMAGVGVGKSLTMCHMAGANLQAGKNVLYITMEMSQEETAKRIDANILNVMINDLIDLPRDAYEKKIERARKKTIGKLIIKEYPNATAHVGHFRHLLNELHLKKNFIPDIIYIDYLNICASSRFKAGNVNSYTYIKGIAEEVRGLAVERNVPVITATQVNRSGFNSTDPEMTDASESFGLPMTADLMLALVSNEELQELNQYVVKQIKNRYGDPALNRRFVIGVDRARMRLYDVEQSAQNLQDTPVLDNTTFGKREKEDSSMKFMTKKAGRKDFSNLKFG